MAAPIKLHTVLANTGNNFDSTEKAQARANIDAADAADVAAAKTTVESTSDLVHVTSSTASDGHMIYSIGADNPIWAHFANHNGWTNPTINWTNYTHVFASNYMSRDEGSTGFPSLSAVPPKQYWFDVEMAMMVDRTTPYILDFTWRMMASTATVTTPVQVFHGEYQLDGSISGFAGTAWFGGILDLTHLGQNVNTENCEITVELQLTDGVVNGSSSQIEVKWSHLFIHEIH